MPGKPFKIFGYGHANDAQYVMRVNFSQALSSNPTLKAFDGGSYPAVGASTTLPTNKVLNNGLATVSAFYVKSTSLASSGLNWKPGNPSTPSANPNRMRGDSYYVTDVSASPPGANGNIYFNMGLEIAQAAFSTSDNPAGMAHDLVCTYTYTGAVPTVLWYANNEDDGGDDTTPVWEEVGTSTTPDSGIRHCKAGTTAADDPNFFATIPASSVLDTAVGMATEA